MNLGYSLLLREYVAASEVDYGDCKQFQITCPACHEAIFKAGKLGQDRQYFAHYAASKSDHAQCEFRVLSIAAAQISERNILGHNQSMEHFFAHFRDFVLAWLFDDAAPGIRRQINWLMARPSYIQYVEYFGRLMRREEQTGFYLGSRESLKAIFEDDRSHYWIERQYNFATDFQHHLLAPNSRGALGFILGVVVYLANDELPDGAGPVFEHAKDNGLKRFLAQQQQAGTLRTLDAFFIATLDILLMMIPYLDLLVGQTGDKANRVLLFEALADCLDQVRAKL